MAFYPQSILDEIRSRVSIVSYIGEHIPLKRAGRNYRGLCPFHAEKTPSFMVSDEKEIFHCFGCGEGGNIFSFVMKYEGLSFSEAVERLAERAGVTLPKDLPKGKDLDSREERKKLLKVNLIAANFFRRCLADLKIGADARNYLKRRGISEAISKQHLLGYADEAWDSLYKHLTSKGVPERYCTMLGLARKREDGRYYDLFRGRVIFPIITPRSEVIGFGGRVIAKDSEGAKYINSPDSPIYHKAHSVYGLNVAHAEIRRLDQVIIVEGYMDLLSLNEAGIFNVVASLGTALTTGQVRMLSRYTKNLVLLFDGDAAGIKAAERSLASFIEVGLMPKVVILPDGDDPDEWIRKHNKGMFEELIASAEPLMVWFIKRKATSVKPLDPASRAAFMVEVGGYLKGIKDPVEFAGYRKVLADTLMADESDIVSWITFKGGGHAFSDEAVGVGGRSKAERLLIEILLNHPTYVDEAKSHIDAAIFSDESFKAIFEILVNNSCNGEISPGKILDMVEDEELANEIHFLSAADEIDASVAHKTMMDCIAYLKRCVIDEQLAAVTQMIKKAEASGNSDEVMKLIAKKHELLFEKNNILGGDYGK